mgnify:CR=1 FL=1
MEWLVIFILGGLLGVLGQLLLLHPRLTIIHGLLIFLLLGVFLNYFSLYDSFYTIFKGALSISMISFSRYMDSFFIVPFLTWVISFAVVAHFLGKPSKRGEW